MHIKKARDYFIIFFVYAVIGWLYEVLLFYFRGDGLINRGFLYGPYLPVYGFGALLLVVLLSKLLNRKKENIWQWVKDILLVLIFVFLISTAVEYVSHYILDTFFNIKLWDYSKQFLNINGRVCFGASRNFAIGGTIFLFLLQPFVNKFLSNTDERKINYLSLVLFVIVIIDLVITLFNKYI